MVQVLLDPVIALTIRFSLASLFAAALAHKVFDWPAFEATLSKYLAGLGAGHASLVRPLAACATLAELGVLASCAWPSRGVLTALAAAVVLMTYGISMLINLMRGNTLLDCGCSWGKARQPVRYALVGRNAGLVLLALPLAFSMHSRQLEPVDVVSIVAAVLTATLLYAALNLLLSNTSPSTREAT